MPKYTITLQKNVEKCFQTISMPINDVILYNYGLEDSAYYIISNGRIVPPDSDVQDGRMYHVVPKVLGGKGGFGSMLRAIGAQIDKTKSREACRDLSGRRMRDVNNEKKLRDWVAKKSEREREKEERRQARLERLKSGGRHRFDDQEYMEQKSRVGERLEEALEQGLQKGSSQNGKTSGGQKRKAEASSTSTKRMAAEWLGAEDIEGLSDLDSSDSGSEVMSEEDQIAIAEALSMAEWNKAESGQDRDGSGEGASGYQRESGHCEDSGQSSSGNCEESGPSSSGNCEESGQSSSVSSDESEHGSNESQEDNDIPEIIPDGQRSEVLSKEESVVTGEGDKTSSSDTVCVTSSEQRSGQGDCEERVQSAHSGSEDIQKITIVLDDYDSATELETLGLDALKSELMSRRLKCGGTLQQRAERLYSVKGLSEDQIDPSLFAKGGKGKKGK